MELWQLQRVKLEIMGAGTGFLGVAILLIWISDFGRACYGPACVWDIWFNWRRNYHGQGSSTGCRLE